MVPVVVLGFPIFDTSLVVFTRLREGRSPMQGGKDHTSHRLASLGLSQRTTVLMLYGLCAVFGLTALDLSQASIIGGMVIGFRLLVIALGAFIFLEYVYIRNKRR
jgi:UDP-GlcNAc:undecaprenyl-phosphate GlcNAc-1-phosphate transferase